MNGKGGKTVAQLIKEAADQGHEVYSTFATVDQVDRDTRTVDVTPLNGDPEVFRVNLQANQEREVNGLVAFPTVGSTVVITWTDKTRAFVSLTTEVEDYIIKTDNESLKDLVNDLLSEIQAITVPTALGPSGVPINAANFITISQRLDNLLFE